MTQIPELQSLLAAVEETFHAPVRTTTGFERLSAAIEFALGESLGASTLKRLWGYIPSRTTPRLTTLDLLARYAGHKDFKAFCDALHAEDSSDYLVDRSYITSDELSPGDGVRIGWAPNRLVSLSYLGGGRFEVLDSANSFRAISLKPPASSRAGLSMSPASTVAALLPRHISQARPMDSR